MGRLIPAGTGFAHHAERRRTREQDFADQLKELEEGTQAAEPEEAEASSAEEQPAAGEATEAGAREEAESSTS